jgi:hypothetical protein
MNKIVTRKAVVGATRIEDSETSRAIASALNGQIPVAALEKLHLDKAETNRFLARELLFWHSIAMGAGMSSLAVLFDTLHVALLDKSKTQMRQ